MFVEIKPGYHIDKSEIFGIKFVKSAEDETKGYITISYKSVLRDDEVIDDIDEVDFNRVISDLNK